MTWRLEINHVTRYYYDRPVVASYNEARVTPLSMPGQLVIDAEVAVQPAADLYCYRDYWGALVHCFDLHDPHDSLVVTARATVDTGLPDSGPRQVGAPEVGAPEVGAAGVGAAEVAPPEIGMPEGGLRETGLPEGGRALSGQGRSWGAERQFGPGPANDGWVSDGCATDGWATSGTSWDHLASPELRDRFYEFLTPSRLVSVEDLAQVAEHLLSTGPTPAEAALAALEWANGELEYVAGATHVHTSAVEAWRDGRGVCQDFAHLSLAVLRAMGIPARYVSGYFYPKSAGDVGIKVLGESHAWIEAWTGEWTGHDPTNLLPVAERYVVVARGRDYADVAPLRGIYSGPPGSSSEVRVELTRRA